MIYRFVTGKLGTGKTLVSVGIAMEYLNRGCTVATNVDFYPENFRNKRNADIRIVRLPDHPDSSALKALGVGNATLEMGPDGNYRPGPKYDPKANSLLLLDELAQSMNSRTWNNKDRQALISHLVLLRKLGWDAYFIVQDIEMIDKQIRDSLASETGFCNNLDKFNIPFLSPVVKAFTGKPLKLPKVHRVRFHDGHSRQGIKTDSNFYRGKHLYQVYNTAQTLSADYDSGTYCLLTPWHLIGRYLPEKTPICKRAVRLFFYLVWFLSLAVCMLVPALRRHFSYRGTNGEQGRLEQAPEASGQSERNQEVAPVELA